MTKGVDGVPAQSSGDPGFQPISAFEEAKEAVNQIIWKVKVGTPITGKDFAEFCLSISMRIPLVR